MVDPDAKTLVADALSGFLETGNDLGWMEDTMPALTTLVSEIAAPDFACVMVGIPPGPEARYPGVGGIAEAWEDWGEAFDEIRAEFEQIRESDDDIVLFVKQIAVTRHGAVEITQPSAMVFAFEQGRLARLEFHLDRAAALRAAGLDSG